MPNVLVEIDQQVITLEVAAVALPSLPSFMAYGGYPTDTLINTIKRLIDNGLTPEQITAVLSVTGQIDANTNALGALNGTVTNLTGQVAGIQNAPAPNGITSATINSSNQLIITRTDGQTINAGVLASIDQTARDSVTTLSNRAIKTHQQLVWNVPVVSASDKYPARDTIYQFAWYTGPDPRTVNRPFLEGDRWTDPNG